MAKASKSVHSHAQSYLLVNYSEEVLGQLMHNLETHEDLVAIPFSPPVRQTSTTESGYEHSVHSSRQGILLLDEHRKA